jgi:hypothetical protein
MNCSFDIQITKVCQILPTSQLTDSTASGLVTDWEGRIMDWMTVTFNETYLKLNLQILYKGKWKGFFSCNKKYGVELNSKS